MSAQGSGIADPLMAREKAPEDKHEAAGQIICEQVERPEVAQAASVQGNSESSSGDSNNVQNAPSPDFSGVSPESANQSVADETVCEPANSAAAAVMYVPTEPPLPHGKLLDGD